MNPNFDLAEPFDFEQSITLARESEQAPLGRRIDGPPKDVGFLGELRRPDGAVSTELSIGVDLGYGEEEIPALVPTLSSEELIYLLNGGDLTESIQDKAVAHAMMRKNKGEDPFFRSSNRNPDFAVAEDLIPYQGDPMMNEAEVNPALYIQQRRERLLRDVGTEFKDGVHPLTGSRSLLRGVGNFLNETLADKPGVTDASRISKELRLFELQQPGLAKTPEGQAYIQEMTGRLNQYLEADEMSFTEAAGHLVEMVAREPTATLEVLASELVSDPLMLAMFVKAYNVGTDVAQGVAKKTGISELSHKLWNLNTRIGRAASISLTKGVEAAGAMGADASMGYLYEVARNLSAGQPDVTHNAEAMAAVNAMSAGAIKALTGSYHLAFGFPSRYASTVDLLNEIARRQNIRVDDVVRYFEEAAYKDLPTQQMAEDLMAGIRRRAENVNESEPGLHDTTLRTTMEDVATKLKEEFITQRNTRMHAPDESPDVAFRAHDTQNIGVRYEPLGHTMFYNAKRVQADYDAGINEARGYTSTGTHAEGFRAKSLREAWKDIDINAMKNWLGSKGGATAYGELQLRMLDRVQQNTMRYPEQNSAFIHRLSLIEAIEQMGGDIRGLRAQNWEQRLTNTAYKAVNRAARRIRENPKEMVDVVKDVLSSPARFAADVHRAMKSPTYRSDAELMGDILRDYQGDAHFLDLKAKEFQQWVEEQIPDPVKREAVSHHMEGNLDRWNELRASRGEQRIQLTPEDITTAKIIRQVLNDVNQAVAARRGEQGRLNFRPNYVPHLIKHRKLMTEDEIIRAVFNDTDRSFQTVSGFTKSRHHPTIMDAEAAGKEFITKDIARISNAYLRSMHRSEVNRSLVKTLLNQNTESGRPFVTSADEAPPGYVEFRHPIMADGNGGYHYVNPNIAPTLRVIFDTNDPSIFRRAVSNLIQISKRLTLGWSGFHVVALGWSGLVAGIPPAEVMKSIIPLNKIGKDARWTPEGIRLMAGENEELVRLLYRNGLVTGAVEELRGDALIDALRNMADWIDNIVPDNRYVKPVGKVVSTPIRLMAGAQKAIDDHLWDHTATSLKTYTAIVTLEKIIEEDMRKAMLEGRQPTDINVLAQRAAQFTNDAFGNQNWAQMAMNVQSNMGHRISMALNRPTTREYIRMLVFAPDWSFSNLRVVGKLIDRSKGEHAKDAYLAYTLRSAVLFAFLAEAIQQSAGQGSIFDDDLKDALRPDLGDGKQIELSKQLSEVIRLGIHGPIHVAKHKMGTLPKALMESDSSLELLNTFGGYSMPIVFKQAEKDPIAALYGAAGVPLYDK